MRSQTNLASASGNCLCSQSSPLRSHTIPDTVKMRCQKVLSGYPHTSNISCTSSLSTSAEFISIPDSSLSRFCLLLADTAMSRVLAQRGRKHGFRIGISDQGTGRMFHRSFLLVLEDAVLVIGQLTVSVPHVSSV